MNRLKIHVITFTFLRYANFSKLMRTIHCIPPWLVLFSVSIGIVLYSKDAINFTMKRTSHGGMHGGH